VNLPLSRHHGDFGKICLQVDNYSDMVLQDPTYTSHRFTNPIIDELTAVRFSIDFKAAVQMTLLRTLTSKTGDKKLATMPRTISDDERPPHSHFASD
jgi:hypothetical protein